MKTAGPIWGYSQSQEQVQAFRNAVNQETLRVLGASLEREAAIRNDADAILEDRLAKVEKFVRKHRHV